MLISVDRVMGNIEGLLRRKAIVMNFMEDLVDKLNSIEDKLIRYSKDFDNISKEFELHLKTVEILKLKEEGIISDGEAEEKVKTVQSELESYLLRNEESSEV